MLIKTSKSRKRQKAIKILLSIREKQKGVINYKELIEDGRKSV